MSKKKVTEVTEVTEAVNATPIQAPKAAPVFKLAKKLPTTNGKRGGNGSKAGEHLTKKFKFAECSYGHFDKMLRHVLNGNFRPAYPHTSGFFATADGIGTTTDQAIPEGITARYDSLESALAAKDIFFSSVKGDRKISVVQNIQLENYKFPERTSNPKPYQCFLLCDKVEDVKAAIAHLEAFEKVMPQYAGMVTYLLDGDNISITPAVSGERVAEVAEVAEQA